MAREAKQNRPKARLPRGLSDRLPAEIAATREMLERIRQVYELYGFEALETPAIEYTEALGKFLPDQDRPNEGVFSFQDDDEQWLSLRYDLTAPLARYVAENFDHLPKPYRSYRAGWVFRNEKPGPGRFRQFFQFDADTVGSAAAAADAEFCMMAADTMEALGIRRGEFVVKVNSRKVLDGILQSIGLSGEAQADRRLTVMRAIDKFDRLGAEGVTGLLGPGRKDESGDFTKGAGLAAEQVEQIMYMFAAPPVAVGRDDELPEWQVEDSRFNGNSPVSNRAIVAAMRDRYPNIAIYQEGLDELEQIAELAHAARYGSRRILIDPSVVRGLEYYTGPVFEVEPGFAITDEAGRSVRLGSLGGGGRYDGLVARFRGDPVPATGFSIGVSRLTAALAHLGKVDIAPEPGPVVVLAMDRDRIADYQRIAGRLRAAGIRAEIYLGQAGMKAQMKYADRRRACCVIIQGSDERARGEVQVKDLIEGAKAATAIASNQEWRESRAAQFAVSETMLVDAVREVLRRHSVSWAPPH